jgi:DNA mismatch repair protein MutH
VNSLPPPPDESELLARAERLAGRSVSSLAAELGVRDDFAGARAKGKVGALVERALGAEGGSTATWDFPALRIELKTIPVDAAGIPRESTYVCTVSLADAERAEWASSWARAKLSRVLWIPVTRVRDTGVRLGVPRLWSPSAAEESVLAADFEEILGRVGAGGIESVTGRMGQWLQLRPKAAHGRVRTLVRAADGDLVSTVPRGFYLRTRFTGAILGKSTSTLLALAAAVVP